MESADDLLTFSGKLLARIMATDSCDMARGIGCKNEEIQKIFTCYRLVCTLDSVRLFLDLNVRSVCTENKCELDACASLTF